MTRVAPRLVAASLALAAASLLLPSVPTYDPWAWLIWGREITELDLSTRGGPSWKPLPVSITTVSALLGKGVSPYVWVAVARAGALLACAFAWSLGWRIVGGAYGVIAG